MSAAFEQVIENIKGLSSDEKALIAHCLILSLETRQEEGVEELWAALSEKRLSELKSGQVRALSWEEIKGRVRGGDL